MKIPTVIKGQPTSKEVIQRLKDEGRPVLLSFSCGKDSIAAWIAMDDAGIDVVPVYMYLVPNLGFVQEEIEYFEGMFGRKVHQYPHASCYRFFAQYAFQAPENCGIVDAAGIQSPDYDYIWSFVKEDLGLPPDTWVADGVRAADSIVRRASFVKHGVMKPSKRKVSPIADWLKGEVMDAIEGRGIKLPIDYEIWGRSFDGLDYRFTHPMKERLPEDYEVLKAYFPLIETDILRHEHYGI